MNKEKFNELKLDIQKKIKAVEYYLEMTESIIKKLADLMNEMVKSMVQVTEPIRDKYIEESKSLYFELKSSFKNNESINKEKWKYYIDSIQEKVEMIHQIHFRLLEMKEGIDKHIEPQKAISLITIRNASVYIYLFSMYEDYLKKNSDYVSMNISGVISNYKKTNSDSLEWGEWARNAQKIRSKRNGIVHEDVTSVITYDQIEELINNINLFILLREKDLFSE
ncbi:hypothetical protein QYF50_07045 [Paenibacillus vini]|uniref:hypothetical protein n=1 Tax=Paenibacillus vini TaxID=1476024 RepID=UPI0025B65E10|nr:hypothetical protein [Paenibacillus vini]MDN4067648.1 hypothetical protein [Paenibacillus vini]